ncbi:MAG TPA: glycosyltransferase [Actinomycetota bacterium]|nr:glycosyltransferase [Actinomycetota bacterium]
MRIVIWHGWLLEGSGSNVGTARLAEAWRAAGHDVVLLCQERHPERYGWIDAHGLVDAGGPSTLTTLRAPAPGGGRCVLLRPQIGDTLPVFVVDRYEGFDDVRRFPDLADDELRSYLRANVEALRAAAAWHGSEAAVTGHAIPGAAIGRRALGAGAYVAKIHGSDLEYAVRLQARFQDLAREGLGGARAVVGPSAEVLERCASFVPEVRRLGRVVPPGVDVDAFRPRPRGQALRSAAERLETDPDTGRGRPDALDAEVERALAARDAKALDTLATRYDQDVADPGAAQRLRLLAASRAPIVGFLGKLIPQKGPARVLAAQRSLVRDTEALIVGFGSHREWLVALDLAYRRGDAEALAWVVDAGSMGIDGSDPGRSGEPRRVTFTGRLDHRYAPDALAAMDVLVVPSILEEAFGMVVAEGAAAGALPLVARHSGLAEVAGALESEVGRPGLFSFEPGDGAVPRIAAGIDRLLSIDPDEREDLAGAVSDFVGREWTWRRAAADLLDVAT